MLSDTRRWSEMSDRQKRNRIALGLVLVLAVIALFTTDISLVRFSDGTGSGTTTYSGGGEGPESDFKPGAKWFVFLDGPRFFRKLAARLLPKNLALISGTEVNVQFLDSFPVASVDANFLHVRFSGRSLWLMFFANYEDHVEWAFSLNGSADWIQNMDVPVVIDSSSGPVLGLQGFVDNEGKGVGILTRKAQQRHRVSVILGKITDSIQKACIKLCDEAVSIL